jgi:hypothetical protein
MAAPPGGPAVVAMAAATLKAPQNPKPPKRAANREGAARP